jgi:tetratricopeptide (TPR) repeat protein
MFRERLGFVLIFIVALTVHSQTPAGEQDLSAEQLAKIVEHVRSSPGDVERLANVRAVAFRLISASRFQDASRLFDAMLEVAPQDQAVLYGAALASFNLKDVDRSEQLARRAIEVTRQQMSRVSIGELERIRARQSDSLVLLGVILAVKRDNPGALKAVREAVALTPGSFDAQFALGRALYGSGDLSGAAAAFRKATTLRPQDPQTRFFLATALENAGDYTGAREAYLELIRLQPNHAEGHLGLGSLSLKEDGSRAEEGISSLLKAVTLKGDLYEARIALGRALIKKGRPSEAVEHLERAAILAPGNPEPHYQLAIAYRRLGQKERAEQASAKVKEINSSRRGVGDVSKPQF